MFRAILIALVVLVQLYCFQCKVLEVTKNGLAEITPKYLFVFAVYYHPFCTSQPGLQDFENAERIAVDTNITSAYDIRFAKVNLKDSAENPMSFSAMSCSGPPAFELFKYGNSIKYGAHELGLTDYDRTTRGMFEWLEKQTKSRVELITNDEQQKLYIASYEFTILGYFKEQSDTGNRNDFYIAAETLKGYNIAEVRNQSLVRAYPQDTVVVNQQFGTVQLMLDQDLYSSRIQHFIKSNANSSGPVFEMTFEQLEQTIDKTLIVFVMFHHANCKVPQVFESAADIAKQNGMLDFLDMKFVTVDIESENLNKFSKYLNDSSSNIRRGCPGIYGPTRLMRLVRYGKVLQWGDTPTGSSGSGDEYTLKGMLQRLEVNTKPAATNIFNGRDFTLIVEYNEVSIVGYFQKGSKARMQFYKCADKLTDYVWGEVINNEMNPYNADTVVLYSNFGESQKNLTDSRKLTSNDGIEMFVKSEAKSVIPVPTRPTPTPPTTTTDKPDLFYQETKQIAIFDASEFQGNRIMLDLNPGCIVIPQSWGKGTWSIRTFGQCVDFYEQPGCDDSGINTFRLDNVESLFHRDLFGVKSEPGFQSMQFCPKGSNSFYYGSTNNVVTCWSAWYYLAMAYLIPRNMD